MIGHNGLLGIMAKNIGGEKKGSQRGKTTCAIVMGRRILQIVSGGRGKGRVRKRIKFISKKKYRDVGSASGELR